LRWESDVNGFTNVLVAWKAKNDLYSEN